MIKSKISKLFFFSGIPVGATDLIPATEKPLDAFLAFIDVPIVQQICDWTNERANLFFANIPDARNRKTNGIIWRAVDVTTMYIYIALSMAMGVSHFPNVAQYWNNDPVFGGPKIFCKQIMSRNRFSSITKFLRFSSAADVDKKNPRTRIEPFLNLLEEKSTTLVDPGLHIAINEALILWKGRLLFKQFIRTKRSRFAISVLHLSWRCEVAGIFLELPNLLW